MKQVNLLSVKSIFDVVLPALLIALLFVTPFVVSDKLYNGVIVAKEFWFFGVVAAMLLYLGIQLLFKKGSVKISLNLTDILLLAFYAWCFIRAIFTPYTPFWHNHKLQVLTGMMVVYFFVKNTIKNERNEKNEKIESGKNPYIISFLHFFIISFILSGFLQAVYGLLQLYGVYSSHHNLFKITGSFFNPAPYALYLAVVFPIALGKILFNEENERIETNEENERNEENEKIENEKQSHILSFFHFFISSFVYYLSFATVIAILLVLPTTMIRASWVGALAGSLVVLQYKYHYLQRVKQFLNSSFRRVLAAVSTIIFVALIGTGIYLLKKDSVKGKLFIWEVTLGKIAEKPFFGHGLGRFEAKYNNWQAEFFKNNPEDMDGIKGFVAGNTKYAFNDYLEMMSEIGLSGVVLFVLVFISILKSTRGFDEDPKNTYGNKNQVIFTLSGDVSILLPKIQLISALYSILLIMHISYPLYSVADTLLIFLIIGILSSLAKEKFCLRLPMVFHRVYASVIGICLFVFSNSFWKEKTAYKYWIDAGFEYKMSNYSNANDKFKAIYTILKYDGSLLQQYGKSLQLSGKNLEAIKILNHASKYTCDYILYCNLGDSYKATKQYKNAEEAYLKAAFMNPHKLQPHYLLAKLYEQINDKGKAVSKAQEIINKKVKIESFSVERIKSEMKKILINDHD